MAIRTYITWQEDLTSDRCELRGFDGELVATVDLGADGLWWARKADGTQAGFTPDKQEAMRLAQAML